MARLGALVLTACAVWSAPLAAQGSSCVTTVRDVVDSARVAAEVARFATWNPAGFALYSAQLDTVAREYDGRFEYRSDAGFVPTTGFRVHAKLAPTVRARRDYEGRLPGVYARVQDVLLNTLGDSLVRLGRVSLSAPADCVLRVLRSQALAVQLEHLRRFERKFGPNSIKLNFAEVILNYGLQFWRVTGVDAEGSPRPWEAVFAYRTTYLTLADLTGNRATKATPEAVTAAEFGMRHYNFGASWGEGSSALGRFLKPGHWAAGLVVAPEHNGAMRYPWRGDARVGAYVAWGGLKAAWLSGKDRRVIVSREMLLIPYVF